MAVDKHNESEVGNWVPLMEYAVKSGISLSTLRRHIKANKIRYKIEKGRYFVKELNLIQPAASRPQLELDSSQAKIKQLQDDLRLAKEEIAELKTLIAFYE